MRNISFSLTTPQFYRREKSVTRRLGWNFLKPDGGELLCGVEKGQGFLVDRPLKRLAVIRTRSARRCRLNSITWDDVEREGFPGMSPRQFVRMFCESHESCRPSSMVTRIEFDFIPGARFAAVGFCRVCLCSEFDAREPDSDGSTCCWIDERGLLSRRATTLCSRCFIVGKFAPTVA